MTNEEKFLSIKDDDTIICMIDEWNEGRKFPFDCHILYRNSAGFDVVYLSGYRSRNDFVPLEDVIAKVDMDMPIVRITGFSGHFKVFDESKLC